MKTMYADMAGPLETKREERNGEPVGVVLGYMAAWTPDRGGRFGVPERFAPGAFGKSLVDHKARGNRPVRLKDLHGRVIGGFPIEGVFEDSKGLFGRGEINLNVQLGIEAFALAKQGVISDFSVGYISLDDKIDGGIRTIFEADLLEASLVDEPMNQDAVVTEVKRRCEFHYLQLAGSDHVWVESEAVARVKAFTDSEDSPTVPYRRAFVWSDPSSPDDFASYKMMIADVVDGELKAIPTAVFETAAYLKGCDMPDADRKAAVQHVERYYAQMEIDSPFEVGETSFFTVQMVKSFTERDLEQALAGTGAFSKKAAKLLAGEIKGGGAGIVSDDTWEKVAGELKRIHI